MVELQLGRLDSGLGLALFPPVSFQTGKVSSNSKVFCCVLAPEKTPQGALSVLSNKVGTKVMSWGDTQEGTLIVLHPRGDWKEIQTSLTTLFSHVQGTSEGILSNFNVDQRRVGRWKSSLDGHQPSRVAQVPPCCSSSWMFYLQRIWRCPSRQSWQDCSPTWWLYWLRNGGLARIQRQGPRAAGASSKYPDWPSAPQVAAESDPLRSPSSNDKTIYACYLCLDLWDVERFHLRSSFLHARALICDNGVFISNWRLCDLVGKHVWEKSWAASSYKLKVRC